MQRRSETMAPRDGQVFRVAIIARISGGQFQKDISNEDQIDHAKQVAAELYSGPIDYHVIQTVGKGERLDRPELEQVRELLRSRRFDVLIAEDIGRIIRGAAAAELCGIAVDHGTRVIAPNDCVDTADINWEEDVIGACRDHVGHNAHVSKRLKQKLANRFSKFGGATSRPIFGYIVSADARTFDDWRKDPNAEPIIAAVIRILRETLNCSYAADRLNTLAVPTGPYTRTQRWTGRLVRNMVRNPLLKGQACRGVRHTVKHHETGRRVAVKNPNGPKYYPCPHLAYLSEDEFADLNARLDEKHKGYGRKPVDGRDLRQGVLKCRTRWPGQHVSCAVCNGRYVWGGHGVKDHLMCTNSRGYQCWNVASFDGVQASERLTQAVLAEIEKLPEFDEALIDRVQKRVNEVRASKDSDLATAKRELAKVEAELGNIVAAIAKVGVSEVLQHKLKDLSLSRTNCRNQLARIEKRQDGAFALPPVEEIKRRARVELSELSISSPEFHATMCRLMPKLEVFPVRCIDGGAIVLRARVEVELASIANLPRDESADKQILRRNLVIDLFNPPQRVVNRAEIARLRASGMTQRVAAAKLSLTVTAAQRASALDRLMQSRGLSDPYELITSPPQESKWRRHLHPRFRQITCDE